MARARKSQRQPGSVRYSPDQSFGIAFLRDGRRVLFGADLGNLLLFCRHGDPVVTVGISGRCSEDNSLFEFAVAEGAVGEMTQDDLGYFELVTSTILSLIHI